jgi:ABC-type amino acid transport substrate-binding protein
MSKPLLSLILLFYTAASTAATPELIKITGLNIEPIPPYQWFNHCSGEWDGANIQIAQRIFKKLNIAIEFTAPIKRSEIDIKAQREKLILGDVDAILAAMPLPYPGIHYIETPIIEVEMKIFYPFTLNTNINMAGLQAIYFEEFRGSPITWEVKKWAKKNNINLLIVTDEESLKKAIKSTPKHYVLDYKYSSRINRKKYNTHGPIVHLNHFYFAMADKPPFNKLFPAINKELAYIKESGLRDLLHQANLRRWVNEREVIQACKNQFISK